MRKQRKIRTFTTQLRVKERIFRIGRGGRSAVASLNYLRAERTRRFATGFGLRRRSGILRA